MNLVNKPTLDSVVDQLTKLEEGRHDLLAKITRVNSYVRRLRDFGLINEVLCLGAVVLRRSYGVDGPTDSGEVVQAGLCLERGLVAVFWDTEDLAEANGADLGTRLGDASDRARPIDSCSIGIQLLVATQADSLLQQFLASIAMDTN